MKILCVHPHYELYGSDRCFIDCVAALRRSFPSARIDVLLPQAGPIAARLMPLADEVVVTPLWVIRRRHWRKLLTQGAFTLPGALARAFARFRRSDLVYINTITAIDYILVARLFRRKALLHVHEAPPGFVGKVLGRMLRAVGIATIFNSRATRDAFPLKAEVQSYVLYNGIRGPKAVRYSTYDGTQRLRLLMLGRVSRGKGQDLLIEACANLPAALRDRLEIRIVGSSFEAQLELEADLAAQARTVGGEELIRFEPFVENPAELFEWCDLVVVPSRVPEGFGRVPVEAMAFGRASIVAAHGGLAEIVADGMTGWHFAPGEAADLAVRIRDAIESPESVREFGQSARAQFEARFAADLIEKQFGQIMRERISQNGEG